MKRVLVYDLPTRVFHWLFAVGLLAAAGIALLAGEHSRLFPYHQLIGLTLALLVLMRIVWGFVGTRYARFGSFLYGVGDLVGYFKGVFAGGARLYAGHNPASGHATIAMLLLTAMIVGSGLMMTYGNHAFEEVHTISAYVLLGVIGAHVLGLIIHMLRHRENLAMSMVTGGKSRRPEDAIGSARPIAGAVFLLLIVAWAGVVFSGYDRAAERVNFPGTSASIRLGEGERDTVSERAEHDRYERQHDEDD